MRKERERESRAEQSSRSVTMASSMDEVKAKLGTLISEKRRTATPDNGKNWEEAFLATFEHLERLGIGNDQISEKLNVIHVAGTKVRENLGKRVFLLIFFVVV